MAHLYQHHPAARHKGLIVSLALFAALVAVFVAGVGGADRRATQEEAALLADAIRSAAVACYATEGRYPATLDALRAQYGVLVDAERFIVRYDAFASNLMPDISVTPREAAR